LAESGADALCYSNFTAAERQPHDAYHFVVVLMFLVQLGAGLGGISVLSHGLVYVDDNVDKRSSAALIGKVTRGLRDARMNRHAWNGRGEWW
jgi:hypothetical protein